MDAETLGRYRQAPQTRQFNQVKPEHLQEFVEAYDHLKEIVACYYGWMRCNINQNVLREAVNDANRLLERSDQSGRC